MTEDAEQSESTRAPSAAANDERLRAALETTRAFGTVEMSLAREAVLDLESGARVVEAGFAYPTRAAQPNNAAMTVFVADLSRALIASGVAGVRAAATALPFATASFDIARGSLSLADRAQGRALVAELARVVKPGGHVAVTALLRGTFAELADLLVEAAEQEDLPGLRGAVLDGREEDPDLVTLAQRAEDAGLVVESRGHVEVALAFEDGAAVVQDPLVRAAVLPMLLPDREAILLPPPLLSSMARAIDTYFDGTPFHLTLHVGVVRARRV